MEKKETTPLPADWTIERVKELTGDFSSVSLESTKRYPTAFPTLLAFARYIEEHEKPPVDPDLLRAREIAASTYQKLSPGDVNVISVYRRGDGDDSFVIAAILAALKEGKANVS